MRMASQAGAARTTPAVSVVIPSWSRSERLERCLDALRAQSLRPLDILVVGDGRGAADGLAGPWPSARVVRCSQPISFCRAANCGIAASRGEWVLLLNDDVVLAPRFIERLLNGIPADHRIGMACGKLLAEDGRTIDSTGQFVSRARTARERGYRSLDVGQFSEPGYVFSVPGAAALYRRRMLEAIAVGTQYFDERLGMYLEDLDLGWRAQRAGWRGYYVPDALARHMRGGTAKTRAPRWPWLRRYYLPQLSPKLQARYIMNRYAVIAKHDSWLRVLRDLPWIAWYELRLWTYLVCFERKTCLLLWRALAGAACGREPTGMTASGISRGV